MLAVKEREEAAHNSNKQIHISDNSNYDTILQASLKVKQLLRNPDKVFSRMKLQSLLCSAQILVKNKVRGKDFLVNYGNCLIQYFGKDETLDSELICHIKLILMKSQKEHETVLEEEQLLSKLFSRLEKEVIFHADAIISLSQETVEMIVLNWIGSGDNPHMALIAKISATSPETFQTVTSMLSEALMRTHCHERVLEVTNEFIQSVKGTCVNEKRDFLKLYPNSCRQIVPFLIVSPEIYAKVGKSAVCEVLSLLFDIFLKDGQEAFTLLSHYSKWASDFKALVCKNVPFT